MKNIDPFKKDIIKQKGRIWYICVFIRSLIFQIILYSWVSFVLFINLPIVWISRAFLFRIFTFLCKNAVFLMKHILRIQCQFENIEIFQQTLEKHGPFLIASKHQSGFETVIFSLFFKDFNIVFKKELYKVPVFGSYMKHMKFIPVNRKEGKKSLQTLITQGEQSMKDNRPILIFPEGSRTPPGQKGKYHIGVAMLYKKLGVPIIPVAHNAGSVWPKKSIIKYPGTIILRVLPPIMPGLQDPEQVLHKLETCIEDACKQFPTTPL